MTTFVDTHALIRGLGTRAAGPSASPHRPLRHAVRRASSFTKMSATPPNEPVRLVSSAAAAVWRPEPLQLSGVVEQGFGRGSAKIGVPTANIATREFSALLDSQDLLNGVYFGFAKIDSEEAGTTWYKVGSLYSKGGSSARLGFPNSRFQAVMNLGVNPTFGDVSERLVEAHVLHSFANPFYGCHMTLMLLGFLRVEQKFESFPALIANIKNDVAVARALLASDQALRFAHD